MSKHHYSPVSIYNELRAAVERLEARLKHPDKKEAIGYVLSMFAMQDRNPVVFRLEDEPEQLSHEGEPEKSSRSEAMRRYWAKKKANAAAKQT